MFTVNADSVSAKGRGFGFSPRDALSVKGKTFTIDNGTVTFVDDPANPAGGAHGFVERPDGTIIFADFVGPLKTAKVTLRSEPRAERRPEAEPRYSTAPRTSRPRRGPAPRHPQLGAAGGLAGSAASDNVNRALGGVNHALESLGVGTQISTKLDTTQATPRPEVEVQIARDLSFQIAWVLGLPPPRAVTPISDTVHRELALLAAMGGRYDAGRRGHHDPRPGVAAQVLRRLPCHETIWSPSLWWWRSPWW